MLKFDYIKIGKDQYEDWNKLVENSQDGTIFHLTPYMESLGASFDLFFVKKGHHINGGICVIHDKKGNIVDQELVFHTGFIMAPRETAFKRAYKINSRNFTIMEDVCVFLDQKYKKISISLSPGIKDLRPFQWFNYNSKNKSDKFKINLRYTSYLDISNISEENYENNDFFLGLSASRKQEIRYGYKNSCEIVFSDNIDSFLDLYMGMMFERTDSKELKTRVNFFEKALNKLKNNIGLDIAYGKSKGGGISSSAIFLNDSKRSYYLLGASKVINDQRYIGSFILWKSFLKLREKGFEEVDLEGINSPKRGWFKLSFGGEIIPYFQLMLDR